MAISNIVTALTQLGKILDATGSRSEAQLVYNIGNALAPYSTAACATFFKKVSSKLENPSSSGARIGDVCGLLAASQQFLEKLASKTIAKDFSEFVSFANSHKGLTIDQMQLAISKASEKPAPKAAPKTPALNAALVDSYASKLKLALGSDPEFDLTMKALEKEKGLRKQEVQAIANRLMHDAPKNLAKKDGLAAIRDLHRASREFDLSLKASGGRSAA